MDWNEGRQALGGRAQLCLLVKQNIRLARRKWKVPPEQVTVLKSLTSELKLSVAAGHLRLIDSNWYVTHSGLLRVARRSHCSGIHVRALAEFSDADSNRWIFKAIVYKSPHSRGFVGFGDADPSNVSPLVHGAEMRVAETRAVNRALRKAYGIGLCSVEELGWSPRPSGADRPNQSAPSANRNNGQQNDQPRLRDRLCLLIRQHQLDPTLVKAYAADYCGTTTLRDASRDQVEAFINHLAERAASDWEALLCHLNSYPKQQEVSK